MYWNVEIFSKNIYIVLGLVYKYEAKSVKGIIFLITTLISIIIMGIAITGYIDLSLTEHQFRDMIEKEINGELNCIGSNKSITKKKMHIHRYKQDSKPTVWINYMNGKLNATTVDNKNKCIKCLITYVASEIVGCTSYFFLITFLEPCAS